MKTIKSIICVTAIVVGLGWLGTIERADQIIYTMDNEVYEEIKEKITCHGRTPSDRKIAEYYLEHYADN